MASVVAPVLSRAISTGWCSSERPDLLAFPPRLRGARPATLRAPFCDFRMKVSSASTMPDSAFAFLFLGTSRKRWRQRNEVSSAILQRLAALRRLIPSDRHCAYSSHASRRRSVSSGVPVSAENVVSQALHI